MRAVSLPGADFKTNDSIVLKDESFHHLVQVCRAREGDEVLLLNARGIKGLAILETLAKKQAVLKVQSVDSSTPQSKLSVLIVIPKKDALEAMIKASVELGFSRIFLLRGAYSQERLPETARLTSLLTSAAEQSNNPWLPEVSLVQDWEKVPWHEFTHALSFDPRGEQAAELKFASSDSILTVIGPEGGFSPEELSFLNSKTQSVAWATPILRAPTALAMAAGWVTARTR